MGFRIEVRLIGNLVTSQEILCLAFLITSMSLSSYLLKICIYFLSLFFASRKNFLTVKCCSAHLIRTQKTLVQTEGNLIFQSDQSIFIT